MKKEHIFFAIILIGISVSAIGMHQANMARNVSKIIFEGGHKHNWFWADGWFELLMHLSQKNSISPDDKISAHLTKSFKTARELTASFTSLKKIDSAAQEETIIEVFGRDAEIPRNEAKQIIWITKMYSGLFPEFHVMMEATGRGTASSNGVIALISGNQLYTNQDAMRRLYKNMRDAEKIYSDTSFIIAEKAYKLYMLFFTSFFIFVGLLFLMILRQRHIKAQNALTGINERLRVENAERKQAEKDLKTSESFLNSVIDNIPIMIFIKDAKDLRYIKFNKAGEKLLGYSRKNLIGKNDYDLFPHEEADSFTEKDRVVLTEKKMVDIPEESIQTKKKGTRILHTRKLPLLDENGEPLFLLGFSEDITFQKRTEQELFKIKKLESVGILAGGIAHDFNNILAAILGNINLALFDETLTDSTKILLSEAEKASIRAKDLTQQLLTFAKGGDPVKKISALENIIEDSANFVLHGDKVICRFDFPGDLWLADIDKGQISQVIQNIVLNASHAMPDGGVINIMCENVFQTQEQNFAALPSGKFVKISIADTGIGIPENIIEKVFDPYFSTKQKGSGLGLAISQSIIKKHGGHLSVTSRPGEGTTFTIYLPASDQIKPGDLAADADNIKSMIKAKVLIMDDEEMVRNVAKEMLTRLGHDVFFSEKGEEAIAMYQNAVNENNKFDIVLMDLTIPGGMGGEEAVKGILAIDPEAKVIVYSGYANDPIMASYKDYGFCAAISKPFQFQKLISVLNHVLNR